MSNHRQASGSELSKACIRPVLRGFRLCSDTIEFHTFQAEYPYIYVPRVLTL